MAMDPWSWLQHQYAGRFFRLREDVCVHVYDWQSYPAGTLFCLSAFLNCTTCVVAEVEGEHRQVSLPFRLLEQIGIPPVTSAKNTRKPCNSTT